MESTTKYEYVDECPAGYECSICCEPLVDPVIEIKCGNMFCRKCVIEWIGKPTNHPALCPHCRSEINDISELCSAPNVVKNVLDTMLVKCPNCVKPFERSLLESHIDSCPVACKYSDSGCKEMVAPKDWELHDKTCLKKFVSCTAAPVGCKFFATRERVHVHMNTCHHFALYNELADARKTARDLDVLRKQVDSLMLAVSDISSGKEPSVSASVKYVQIKAAKLLSADK